MWLPDQAPELKNLPVWTFEQFRSLSENLASLGRQQSYTPSWFAATTNPTLGNGSLVGRFVELGQWIQLALRLTIGSTTTLGAGAWTFGLPRAPAMGVMTWQGPAVAFRTGGNHRLGVCHMNADSVSVPAGVFNVFADDSAITFSSTVPFAWAVNDGLIMSLGYPFE